MSSARLLLVILLVSGLLLFHLSVFAKNGRGLGMSQKRSKAPSRTGKMAEPSELRPVFPDKASCIEISSPYGSQARYDGSRRPKHRFGGRHGGIDLSLTEGTPLLAVAGGVLIRKGEGGRMEGIYLWLRHSPEDTGLPYWVYSKYQHLQSVPQLPLGTKVVVGQTVAFSGKTGTTGGHYSTNGYPHLHLATRRSSDGDIEIKGGKMVMPDSHLIDPLSFFHEAILALEEPIDSPAHDGVITIPYMITNGHLWPRGTCVVWPVACQAK